MGNSQSSQDLSVLTKSTQESITNILNENSSSINNLVSTLQNLNVRINAPLNCGSLNITNDMVGDFNFVTQVTNSVTNDIVTKLDADVTNKIDQIAKIVYGAFGVLGSNTQDSQNIQLKTIINQVIRNTVTTKNITNSLNSILVIQNNSIEINMPTNVVGDCNFKNTVLLSFVSKNIVDNIIKNVMKNESLARVVNDVKQSMDKQVKGINDIISAFMGPLVLIAVVVAIAMAVTGKGVAENVFNWKFPLAIGTVLGGYVLLSAKTKKFGPFKESPPRQYWGCERKGDFYTGKCVEYTDEKTKIQYGPYKSEQDCVEGVRNGDCGQYWGCELDSSGANYTGRCKEYTNKEVATAPYASELACKTSKNCRQYWDCEKDEQGFTTGNGCKQVDISVIPIDKDMRATKEECEDKMECSQHWGLQINGIPYSADNPCEQKISSKDAGCVSKADCIAKKGSC